MESHEILWKFVEFHTKTTTNHSGIAKLGFHQVITRKIGSCIPVVLHLRPAMHAIQERSGMFQLLATEGECTRNDQAPSQAARDSRKKAKRQREHMDKTKGDEE